MSSVNLQNGDAVYALVTIANDGSVPEYPDTEVFAKPGTMGMLINTGHFEEYPEQTLFLVSFENDSGELGPPVTCLAHEIGPVPMDS
jgi:nitrogen fixation protein NifZ